MTEAEAAFQAERARLISIGYRMLGILAEAEDAVQDCWLRWQKVDRSRIRSPQAWLTTAMTRLCIDRLRAAKVVREAYTGPWLPEPMVGTDDPSYRAELASGLTMALMVMMETMSATERAAFILREAFDYDYNEMAEVLDITPANARKLVSRARTRAQDGERRFASDPETARRLLEAFGLAASQGDLGPLEAMLHQDVVLHSDGGGVVKAALNPIVGRDHVIRFVLGLATKAGGQLDLSMQPVSGGTGFVLVSEDRIEAAIALTVEEGQLVRIDIVRNPEKLAHVPLLK